MKRKSKGLRRLVVTQSSRKQPNSNTNNKEMQIVVRPMSSSSSSSTPFELPDGWVVERRPRRCSRTKGFDKYYYEPGTGRKFRSLLSIQKYLHGETGVASKRLKPGNETNMQIVPHIFRSCSSFNLPDGWIVKEKSRSNVKYAGVIDRCYIEPGTGKQFRSLRSVKRYLTEAKEYADGPKTLLYQYVKDGEEYITMRKTLKVEGHTASKSIGSKKRHVSCTDVETSILDLCSPPTKIKWVLSPGASTWSPFMDDALVPKSVRHTWSQAFVWALNDS